jgi:heme/copper-type cytochrome/quinol oxidase subunit 1
MNFLTKINEFRKKITYEKGLVMSIFSGGVIFIALILIFQIFILLSSPIIGFEAIGLFWLPTFPVLAFVEKPNGTTALLLSAIFWFFVGCIINLIFYMNHKLRH